MNVINGWLTAVSLAGWLFGGMDSKLLLAADFSFIFMWIKSKQSTILVYMYNIIVAVVIKCFHVI